MARSVDWSLQTMVSYKAEVSSPGCRRITMAEQTRWFTEDQYVQETCRVWRDARSGRCITHGLCSAPTLLCALSGTFARRGLAKLPFLLPPTRPAVGTVDGCALCAWCAYLARGLGVRVLSTSLATLGHWARLAPTSRTSHRRDARRCHPHSTLHRVLTW